MIDESDSEGYIEDMQDGSDLDRPEDYNRAIDDYVNNLKGRSNDSGWSYSVSWPL